MTSTTPGTMHGACVPITRYVDTLNDRDMWRRLAGLALALDAGLVTTVIILVFG